MFKSLFCCFTPSSHRNRKSLHHKNGSILQNTTNSNANAIQHVNPNHITLNVNSLNSNHSNKNDINNNNNDNLNVNVNNNNLTDPYKNIIASVNSNNSNISYLSQGNNEHNNDHLQQDLPVSRALFLNRDCSGLHAKLSTHHVNQFFG